MSISADSRSLPRSASHCGESPTPFSFSRFPLSRVPMPPKGRARPRPGRGRCPARAPARPPTIACRESFAMGTSANGRAPSPTFLTHYFGGGLLDRGECYAIERFRAMANGEIRRCTGETSARSSGRSRPKPEVVSVDRVRELRPAYSEIIVCTALGTRTGMQYWGASACGLWGDREENRAAEQAIYAAGLGGISPRAGAMANGSNAGCVPRALRTRARAGAVPARLHGRGRRHGRRSR